MSAPRSSLAALTLTAALLAAASARAQTPPPPFATTAHTLTLTPSAEHLAARHDLSVETLYDATLVPLVPSSVGLSDARLDGLPAPLTPCAERVCAVILQPGPHALTFEYSLPGAVDADRTHSIPLVPQPLLHLHLLHPEGRWTVTLDPSPVSRTEPIAPSSNRSRTLASIPLTDHLNLRWQPQSAASADAARPQLTLHHTLTASTTSIDLTTTLQLDASGEPIESVELLLPPGLPEPVLDGDPIGESQRSAGGNLRVTFATPAQRRRLQLTFHLANAPTGTFTLPLAEIGAANTRARHTWLTLLSGADIEIRPTAAAAPHLTPVPVGELTPSPDPAWTTALAFRLEPDLKTPVQLDLQRYSRADVLTSVIQHAHASTTLTGDDKAVTWLSLQILNHDRQFLRLRFPPQTRVWSLSLDDQLTPAARDDDDLLIPLRATTNADARPNRLLLAFSHPAHKPSGFTGTVDLQLPAMNLVATDVRWTVHAPSDYAWSDRESTLLLRPNAPPPSSALLDANSLSTAAPTTDLHFTGTVAHEDAPLTLELRYFNARYLLLATWLAWFALFCTFIAGFAHLLLAIRHGRPARSPLWTSTAAGGLALWLALQLLLPIPWPTWWILAALFVGAGTTYGTFVFWTTIISLAHNLWQRFTQDPREDDLDFPLDLPDHDDDDHEP